MSRTLAQADAARLNGRLSLGPVTHDGRMAASRNSTKHGMSGLGKCLPPDMAVELAAEVKVFAARHQPRDDYERDLVRRAALGNLRARRLHDASNALTDERVRNAFRAWDHQRADEIASLAARLEAEPEAATRLLKRTAEGCDHLGDAWEALGHVLKSVGRWDEVQLRHALNLLGHSEPPTLPGTGPLAAFWGCVVALDGEAGSIDVEEARDALVRFVRDQGIELERQGRRLWTYFDQPARDSAATRAAFDPGPEFAQLQRYLRDAERLRRQSLDELARLRRQPAPPARNEPEPAPAPAATPPPPPARNEPEPAVASLAQTLKALDSLGSTSIDDFDWSSLDSLAPGASVVPLTIGRRS